MKYALVIFETDESRRRIQADRIAYRKKYEGWIGSLAAAGNWSAAKPWRPSTPLPRRYALRPTGHRR
ncbi:hypothetical protein HKK72_29110 [Actinomadura sp. HBU206391]|nr:hypothetical protein [Actinomadura sp. HBU206391]